MAQALTRTRAGKGVSAGPGRACLHAVSGPRWGRPQLASSLLAVSGIAAMVVALILDPGRARSAAGQVWSPFVLVAGLLLVGLVADDDGLFSAVGHRLAVLAPDAGALFAAAAVTIALVTALLNLDTSVVFLTPVLVHAARSRGWDEAPMLVGCLLLANAGSLLLPGSNLTNLMVLGHLHLSGGQFLRRMLLPWAGSVLVTGSTIAVVEWTVRRRRGTRTGGKEGVPPEPARLTGGLGIAAVVVATGLILVSPSPALPVLAVGVVVAGVRLVQRRNQLSNVLDILGIPVLIGLFGIAVALGTLGRAWSGPVTLLSHLDAVNSAIVAAGASIVVNNLPAAALLAAHVPPHPFALLVGLNIGPNLFVTGSLAWFLWWRTATAAGANPPVARAVVLGLISVPMAMTAALALLAPTGAL